MLSACVEVVKKPPRTSLQCGYIYKLQGRGEYSVWSASSVGRASGRYHRGPGFEPRSGRIFFSPCYIWVLIMHAFRIFKITTADVKCLCGSCKKPPRTSSQCGYIYIKLQDRGKYSSGSVAQLVERRDGILKVTGSSPGLAGYFSHFVIYES